jgi:SAM-dependent methyltransferase
MPWFPGSDLYWDPRLGTAERWYCRFIGAPFVGLRIRFRLLSKLLPVSATAVLDAGCGRGVITRYLARRYSSARVDGLDENIVGQQINEKIAGSVALSGCNFIVGDVTTYTRPDYYDLIVSIDNLEHVVDDVAVLKNFFVSLKEGGTLIVHVPHFYRRWPVFKWSENFDVPGHVRPGYHLPQLTERVRRAGFTVARRGFSYGWLENLINNVSYKISAAEERNKLLYAGVFPLLNMLAWCGQWGRPKGGAGVWLVAIKDSTVRRARSVLARADAVVPIEEIT